MREFDSAILRPRKGFLWTDRPLTTLPNNFYTSPFSLLYITLKRSEIRVFLRNYTEYSGNSLTTFRDNLSVQSSKVKN